jgi:predicted GNAT family acetyltransferase
VGRIDYFQVEDSIGACRRQRVREGTLSVTVSAIPEANRYVIFVDEKPAGFTEFKASPGVIAFLHTEIQPEYGGQGLAGKLIRYALDDVRKLGLAVLPYCEFVRGFIAKNEEYLDLVPAERRAEFDL